MLICPLIDKEENEERQYYPNHHQLQGVEDCGGESHAHRFKDTIVILNHLAIIDV